MKIKLYSILIACCLFSVPAQAYTAQDDSQTQERWDDIKDHTPGILQSALAGVEYRVKAGIAIGGTAPLPIPPQIQEVKSFNPLINISLEAELLKTISEKWGLSFGFRLETKGMETNARVKSYNMKMVTNDGAIAGVFTGMVNMKVTNSYLTLPVLAVWKPSKRWDMKLGPYVSYRLSGDFSGAAYDGYLREGSPVGEKIVIDHAIYSFSPDLRRLNWGWQLGADWRAFPHLLVGLDLTWGMNSIFKKDFDVIAFDMYPIFLNLNFGYAF